MNPVKIIYFSVIGILLYVLLYYFSYSYLGFLFAIVIFVLIYKITKINRAQAGDFETLYQNMPWEPQNIPQAIYIGNKSGYKINENDFGSVAKFYTTISMYLGDYFEIIINEKVIQEYEEKYGANAIDYKDFRRDALVHYTNSVKQHSERVADIENAIMIKKKPRGNFKETKVSPIKL